MDNLDVVVIGAGVVGLAVARALAMAGRSVTVLERNPSFGMETSSRNSEVIHAGIYYPKNSLKARLCVKGKQQLYQFCHEKNIPCRQAGKLLVAVSDAEEKQLHRYINSAGANGVHDLSWLTAAEIHKLEPEVRAVSALYSPSTGIIDSHQLMLALLADIERHRGVVIFNSEVIAGEAAGTGMKLILGSEVAGEHYVCQCAQVVNAAGLQGIVLARSLGVAPQHLPEMRFARGHYYTLSGKAPFGHLIYPIADRGGLGIHVTLDLSGQVRFGPDVQWIDQVDYQFDAGRLQHFVSAIKRYYPGLDETRLQPAYTGIRPKTVGPDAPPGDFIVQTESDHGIPGLINLLGIESPGLTASMALADEVVSCL